MKFLLGLIIGILGTLTAAMLVSTPRGSIWSRYIQTAVFGGMNHANAQRAISRKLFDPFSAQFDGLRTVKYDGQEFVCGYVNAKNRMGAYIGKHQFVYDPTIDLAIVDNDDEVAKLFKDKFQPCLPESARTSVLAKSISSELSNSKPSLAENTPIQPSAPTPTAEEAKTLPPVFVKPSIPWVVIDEKSKIDDSTNVFISVSSKERLPGRHSPKDHARMTIACRDGKTLFWINFGGHYMSDYQFGDVTYRVDKRPAKKRHMQESTDHLALGLWNAGTAIPFAKELFGGSSLYVRATPHSESQVEMEFDITGLEDAIEPLAQACKWPSPKTPAATKR